MGAEKALLWTRTLIKLNGLTWEYLMAVNIKLAKFKH